ncbi:MAG: TRAP transporter small permease subunit [Deltaproteobacteria bacterium]|jgi:TRAP-type C4-dicarboxylate transport system permease small subunit|nr:MAG: TRAP transporter small permease subunit [Deltaproteobacteria bacterium]
MLSKFSPILILDKVLEAISVLLLFVSALIAFIAVITRYLLGFSLAWSFELLMIMLTYITFICAYLALRKKMHLRIDFLYRRMPFVLQSVCFFIVYLVIAGVAVVMTYWGFQQTFKFPGQVTEVMRIPVSVVYIVIPLCGLAILMSAFITIYQGIRRYREGLLPEEF